MTATTVQSVGGHTTYTRGPAPVVLFGNLLCHPDHPGVTFVLPYHAETVGGPQADLGYSVPLVVVTADLTVDQVMAAALAVGATFRIKQQMRRAVETWATSVDWQQNPHRVARVDPTGG